MGVDISTYRCRIGTFKHGPGIDVVLLRVCVNYIGCLKVIGVVTFIGLLLLMAGIEANPGPLDSPTAEGGEDAIQSVLKQIGLDKYVNIFEDNMIGVNEVGDMTNEDFQNIGIPIGARIRIQKACKQHVNDQLPVDTHVPISNVSSPSLAKKVVQESIEATLKVTKDDRGQTELEHSLELSVTVDSNQGEQQDIGSIGTIRSLSPNQSLVKEEDMESHETTMDVSEDSSGKAEVKQKDTGSIGTICSLSPKQSVFKEEVKESHDTTMDVSEDSSGKAEVKQKDIGSIATIRSLSPKQSVFKEEVKESHDTTMDVSEDNSGKAEVKQKYIGAIATIRSESTIQSLVKEEVKESHDTTMDVSEDSSGKAEVTQKGYQHGVHSENVGSAQTSIKLSVNQEHKDNTSKDDALLSNGSTEQPNLSHEREECENSQLPSDPHAVLYALLERLKLTEWFPGKISGTDVTSIGVCESSKAIQNISNVPWLILKQILMANTHARDHTVDEHVRINTNYQNDNDGEFNEDIDDLCPLDVFIAIFHCCDSFLKQLLYKKLFMCRLAVPFLYRDPICRNFIVPVWPLRTIVIEWIDCSGKSNEKIMLDQPTKVITFARFGRPAYSKSKLLNHILSDNKHDTFFNKDCPLGMSDRSLCVGYIEASWYIPGRKKGAVFNEFLTFVNVRGDLRKDLSRDKLTIIQHLSNIFVIVIDVQTIRTCIDHIAEVVESTHLLIAIVTNSGNMKHTEMTERVSQLTNKIKTKGKELKIVLTYMNQKKRNASDMEKTLRTHIEALLNKTSSTKLSAHFEHLSRLGINSDEDNEECVAGKYLADTLLSKIKASGPQIKWKTNITPLQYNYWKQWSMLKKKLHRSWNHLDDTEKIKMQMSNLRKSQVKEQSEPMKHFIETVVTIVESKNKVLYFIEWLKIYVDDMSRCLLPGMRTRYNDAWNKLKELRGRNKENNDVVLVQEKHVKNLEEELAGASFGIEHLFREMGQIYEAWVSTKTSNRLRQRIPNVMAKLITYGQPFELLDGDASNIPSDWVTAVLRAVRDLTKCERILTLSVLGIQSSGKSTLLNTMFGLQFSVSAGRCTRGVYVQLLKMSKSSDLPFDHVMVIDSEGLRAPELLEQKRDHDNELATLVIGLGDITLLNIKGENTAEINDILEITVHAFLRLKAANKKLDLRQMCVFAHQNVAAINAADKMKYGVQKLEESLDKMTKEAAIGEHIHEITSFNQVIKFNGTTNVWYLPDLWQGDPPMAATNVGYSTKVSELKTSILKMAISDKDKSYKCMDDILSHATDLWKGILAEDFVFSFKNSLEIKAYLQIETEYKQLTWQLESFVQIQTQEKSKNKFSTCKTDNEVETMYEDILESISIQLDTLTTDLITQLEFIFEKCDYREIVVNWKQSKLFSMTLLSEKLRSSMGNEIRNFAEKRKVQIMVTLRHQQHEERLHEESIKLASSLKGQDLSETNINIEFERIWNKCVRGIQSESQEHYRPMKTLFDENLRGIFSTDKAALANTLDMFTHHDRQHRFSQLKGSFKFTEIGKDDYGAEKDTKHHTNKQTNSVVSLWERLTKGNQSKLQYLQGITNYIFINTDCRIKQLMQQDNEISNMHVGKFLHTLTEWFEDKTKESTKNGITLATSYKLKVYVFISCHAQQLFEQHNITYRASHGIKAQMDRYKVQVRTRFEDCLNDRKAEATAATLFRNELEVFITENVTERLTTRVENALMNYLPDLKYHLITDILTNLVENASFSNFVDYIQSPETHAHMFIIRQSTNYLFDSRTHKYIDLSLNEISVIISDIRSGIIKASKACINSNNTTIDDWINHFSKSLKECNIEIERFRDVKRENVVDFDNFQSELQSKMSTLGETISQIFINQRQESVKWTNGNPYTSVFNRIWGCKTNCEFCGEPCSKSSDHIHSNTNHTCIQHRPSGVKGVRNSVTKEVSLSSCNFDIQSTLAHKCNVFGFLCNPDAVADCSKGQHLYKNYRTYLPLWDIEPCADMEDTCKLWMWFMASYRQELAEHYKYKVNNIPKSWANITKYEALESLRFVYKRREI